MDYSNLTTSELVREAECTGNELALVLNAKLEMELDDERAALEELIEELVDHHASKVEEAIEEANKEDLEPDSDNISNYADCIEHNIDENRVAEVIREMERSDNPGVTEETLEFLLDIVDFDNHDLLRDLAYDISTAGNAATNVKVTHGYGAVPYSVACISLGEQEFDLEYWLEDVPEALREKVCEKLTGSTDGTLFYIDNTYVSVDLVIDFNWLEEWVADQKERAAEAA